MAVSTRGGMIAAASIVLAGVAIGTLVGVSQSDPDLVLDKRSSAELRQDVEVSPRSEVVPSSVIAALGDPQTEADAVDFSIEDLGYDRVGIVPESVRYLGEDAGSYFWAGLDSKGNICLIIKLDDRGTTGSACNTPELVEEHGLVFGFGGNETYIDNKKIVALLVPDSADPRSVAASPWEGTDWPWVLLSNNLVVADQSDLPLEPAFSFLRDGDTSTVG